MSKKHQLNIPWIHFHVREALDELRELEALLEYLETGKKPKGMLRTDVDRFCKEGKPDKAAIEIHLAASLAHAYHHLNFGWNSRRCVDTRRATDAFSKNENFPRPSEAAGCTFDRFWSKRCLKCLAKKAGKWFKGDKNEAKDSKESTDEVEK